MYYIIIRFPFRFRNTCLICCLTYNLDRLINVYSTTNTRLTYSSVIAPTNPVSSQFQIVLISLVRSNLGTDSQLFDVLHPPLPGGSLGLYLLVGGVKRHRDLRRIVCDLVLPMSPPPCTLSPTVFVCIFSWVFPAVDSDIKLDNVAIIELVSGLSDHPC